MISRPAQSTAIRGTLGDTADGNCEIRWTTAPYPYQRILGVMLILGMAAILR